MKNLIILIFPAFFFISCDKIPPRVAPPKPNCILNTPVVKTNTATSNFRKVLLEDYTGHQCGNCPPAAEKAEELINTYKDSLIVLANHITAIYGAPLNDTLYREEFRNSTANDWDLFFKVSGAGLPNGIVNRAVPYVKGYSTWSSFIPAALRKPQQAKLDITTYYDIQQNLLNVKVKTTFLENFSFNTRLIIVLTQDSIIAHQKDYGPPPGVELNEPGGDRRLKYQFDHIMIGAINGAWGETVKNAPSKGDTVTIFRECHLLDKCFYKNVVCIDDHHVSVVAFVYNDDTKEVIQVEKVKIR